ncbi:MAG: toll/interleukin-1 receptor domain-containing protein [candidate division WOR-3 bacterium]|nr:toll/interleukin-1 receptor domain-containing protein [candidate division WOR-3 bacterium]
MPSKLYNAFLSYNHIDSEVALSLHDWLTRVAGLSVWIDVQNLPAGTPVAARLPSVIPQCEGCLLLLSRRSLQSGWVMDECETALDERARNRRFRVVGVRIDDCDLAKVSPALRKLSWIDLPDGRLNPAAGRQLLSSLHGRMGGPLRAFDWDCYVSRGWKEGEGTFADDACTMLDGRGIRLLTDAPRQAVFSEDRIATIMQDCGAHIVILPRRSDAVPAERQYRYLLRELDISSKLKLPQLAIYEPGTPLPPGLPTEHCEFRSADDERSRGDLDCHIDELLGRYVQPSRTKHIFLATEYKGQERRLEQIRAFLEEVTGVSCMLAIHIHGDHLREQIVNSIASSVAFLGNLTAPSRDRPGEIAVNVNTCVEAGIALGIARAMETQGVPPLPVFLLAYAPRDATGRTEQLPFFFRDFQIHWHADDVDLLGLLHKLALPFEQRIINYEITRTAMD